VATAPATLDSLLLEAFPQTQRAERALSPRVRYPVYSGEFWTAQQRQMDSLHYVLSYRGSFKPELPAFFIRRYSRPGDVVLDPFAGRGTTVLQSVLDGRRGWGNDANPMFERVCRAKVCPATIGEVEAFLGEVDWDREAPEAEALDLGMFYHERTLRELLALRHHLRAAPSATGRFVELVALSRLHGHSSGFFSAYSFPQISVPREAQRRINARRNQVPEYRDVSSRVTRKARQALKDCDPVALREAGARCMLTTDDARDLVDVPTGSVHLIVTSPPFLDKVDYLLDNWLEMWFLGIDLGQRSETIVQTPDLEEWMEFMSGSLAEMRRVLRPGGTCVVEVGDVNHNRRDINLDELIADLAVAVGLRVEAVLVQVQSFTKLAHCFRVENNRKGTNTNRCVVLRK